MRSKMSKAALGIAVVAGTVLLGALPAYADDVRSGFQDCSNVSRLVRVTSTTTNTGGGSFSVTHGAAGTVVGWQTAGFHGVTFSVTSANWVVTTNKTINSAGASCAGL